MAAGYLLLGQETRDFLYVARVPQEQAGRSDASTDQSAESVGSGGIQMKKQDFDNLVESVKQAGKIRRGEMKASRTFKFSPADIKGIRLRLHKSQSEFALMIGVSVSTLQNWEQGRRNPEGPARALLKIATENPKAVVKALSS